MIGTDIAILGSENSVRIQRGSCSRAGSAASAGCRFHCFILLHRIGQSALDIICSFAAAFIHFLHQFTWGLEQPRA